MTYIEQLNLWVDNKSVHDDEQDQCCPDFSCCNKEINTPPEIKELFRDAYLRNNEELQYQLLLKFLGAAISTLPNGKKVYIAGEKL